MAQKQVGRKVYRTMQGKQIDMDLLRKKNELTPAVGNAKVNARGDELGPGGQIIKKHEDVVRDYYSRSQPVPDEEPAPRASAVQESIPDEEPVRAPKASKASKKVQETQDEWIEDEDGNFVKRGE